jgi:hypothetical protein
MRLFAKTIAVMIAAVAMQLLIDAAGGCAEVSFHAQCFVQEMFPDAARHRRLLEEATRLLRVERAAEMERMLARQRAAAVAAAAADPTATRTAWRRV